MNSADVAWARADLYVSHELDEDNEWLTRHGRHLRRTARVSRELSLIHQAMPMTTRYRWWRRYGEPRGLTFDSLWVRDYRKQLHLANARGSDFAARQLAQTLINDVTEAA